MPDKSVVIKGGTIVDFNGDRQADIRIVDGVVDSIAQDLSGDRVLDAGGCAASDASCGTPAGRNAGPISENPNNPGLQPGDSRCYQAWYRDPTGGPCGTRSNPSNAQLVLWGA